MKEYNLYIRQIVQGLLAKKRRNDGKGVVFFLGAGFSHRNGLEKSAGLGSGEELASVLGEELEEENEKNLQRVAEYYESMIGKADLIQQVKSYIKDLQKTQESHQLLSELIHLIGEPSEFIFTVNYDTLLESYYKQKYEKDLEVWRFGDAYNNSKQIYKLHGCITAESNLILTSEDYYKVKSNEILMKKLFSVFRENTCVFIGFKMEDNDFIDLLFNIRANNNNLGDIKHYLILPDGGIHPMRARYLKDKFNIEHLPMKGAEFLLKVMEEFKKKVGASK
ncbi:SIR2 family protein [Bacillus cereus]|nr:SIR2 family protein [Bacillus cereus]